jgi:ribonucleotide reductase alpha subunit
LYTDQSISTNIYWTPTKDFIEGKMPMRKMISIILEANKLGMKTLYYSTFIAEETESDEQSCEGGGCEI